VTPSLPHSVARRAGTVPTAPCSAHDDRPASRDDHAFPAALIHT
jgi:hypothetical protein